MRYIIIFILSAIVFASCTSEKQNDWRYTLSHTSTEPFGTFLAYDRLKDIFPSAKVKTSYEPFKEIKAALDKSYFDEQYHLRIIIADEFYPTDEQIDWLKEYVEKGGDVLLATSYKVARLDSMLKKERNIVYKSTNDSMLTYQFFNEEKWNTRSFKYPIGQSYFTENGDVPIVYTTINDERKAVAELHVLDKGEIVLSAAPVLFTNYFLIQKENVNIYEYTLSHFGKYHYVVHWSSLSRYIGNESRPKSNFWKLLEHASYRYAFFALLILLALYLLFESKRRQRAVPVIAPIKNESLEFTETIGKLYFNENDEQNLSQKMIKYYLEHIRSTYNIQAKEIDGVFAKKLSKKINKNEDEVNRFIEYLQTINQAKDVSPSQIKKLYQQIKIYS